MPAKKPLLRLGSAPLMLGFVAGIAALFLWFMLRPADSAQPALKAQIGSVAILTSLPLFTAEALSVEEALAASSADAGAPHPLGRLWQDSLTVAVYDDAAQAIAARPELLIMAQPRPLSPDQLAAFDAWVRGGGRALVFADPALFWHSIFAIGDPRRPEGATLLSPLFAHWGLEQRIDDDQPDGAWPMTGQLPPLMVEQAGHFVRRDAKNDAKIDAKIDDRNAECAIVQDGLIANCQIGKGRAVLVADADMLQARFFLPVGREGMKDSEDGSTSSSNTGNWRGVKALLLLAAQ